MASSFSSSDEDIKYKSFLEFFENCKHFVVLSGAGVSAESGIPTFRGEGGYWRNHNAQDLATPMAFRRNPVLVWQFYQYRRLTVFEKKPNKAHFALVDCEKKLNASGKKFTLITQNVDAYHKLAGSENVIEMHGNITQTRCTKCHNIEYNDDKNLIQIDSPNVEYESLPKCNKNNCGGLLRPNVVWFNESLDPKVMNKIHEELNSCDLFMIIGTSGIVYPAASFGEIVSSRNVPVVEVNVDESGGCPASSLYFRGKAGEILPKLFQQINSKQ